MTPADSMRVVAMLFAYRPNLKPPEETVMLWARSIQRYEREDAIEAAQILGEGGRWTPVLADFLDAIVECLNDRINRERKALPATTPGALLMASNPCDDEGVPATYAQGGPALTIAEYLKRRPDMRDRAAKLGVWAETMKMLEQA